MTNYNNNYNNNNENRNNSGFDSYSQITVIGRLTGDPKSEQLQSGKQVANASIAVNHGNNNTDFWNIEAWVNGNNSTSHDYLVQYTGKGDKLFIVGIPKLKRSKDQNGNYNYFPTITVTQIRGLDTRGGQNKGNNQASEGFGQPQGGFQPPQQQQPASQGGFQQQGAPQGGQQPQGGFQPPQGGFQPPQGGFQPPQGGFQPPQQQGAPMMPPQGAPAPNQAPNPSGGPQFAGPPIGAPRQN